MLQIITIIYQICVKGFLDSKFHLAVIEIQDVPENCTPSFFKKNIKNIKSTAILVMIPVM